MFWRFFRRSNLPAHEVARRTHEMWLNDAFDTQRRMRRIPIRMVDGNHDGFGSMMNREDGRRRAERWWDLALEEVIKEDAARFGHD
jgi:hypothetical protein